MLKYAPYSYSKISSFEQCPLKFKFQYIDKINLLTENKHLEKGVRIHQIIEFYNPWNKTLPEFNYKLLNEEEQKEIELIAQKFCNSDLGKKYLLNDYQIGHEIEFGLDYKLNPINYYNQNQCMLRGKIDFLIKENDKIIIVDWKTGKVPNQKYISNHQTMLYAIWCFKMFNDINTIQAHYVYVEHNEIIAFIFTKEMLKNYTKTYGSKIKSIETEKEFNKKIGPLCDYCDYYKQNYCNGYKD